MAVHEILPISEEMGRAIARGESVEVLREMGVAMGYRPMQFDAIDRVEKGLTTYEEARRLIFFAGTAGEESTPAEEASVEVEKKAAIKKENVKPVAGKAPTGKSSTAKPRLKKAS
jgi:hypothetical protein